jgi:hypothetical protein
MLRGFQEWAAGLYPNWGSEAERLENCARHSG